MKEGGRVREKESASRRELKLRPMTLSGCSRGFSVDVHRKKREIHRHVDCQTRRRRRRRTSIILRWRLTHERKSRRGRCSLSLSLSWDEEGILLSPYETPKIPTITQYIHATWISFSVSSSYTEREILPIVVEAIARPNTHNELGNTERKGRPC